MTTSRLRSYLQAAGGDVEAAIHLYDWNTSAASALHGDLGRLEVIFRNAVEDALLNGDGRCSPLSLCDGFAELLWGDGGGEVAEVTR